MTSPKKIDGKEWKIIRFIFPVLVSVGLLGLLIVEKGFAQVSQGTASFAFTGSAELSDTYTPILPGEGVKAGPFRIHPFLGAAEVYTDNVFRTNTNRQDDFIHVIAPGIQVQLPFAGHHQFVLDYRASQWIHQRFSRNDALRQDSTGQVLLNFPGGLNLYLQGGYTSGFDFRGSTVDVQAREPTKWKRKNFVGEAETIGSQLGVRFRAQVTDLNFENNNQAPARDRFSSQGDFTVFGLIAPKTFALLNFGISRVAYDQNTQLDSSTFRVSSGLRWSATGKTNGEIQVGYEILNFDRAPVVQPSGSLLSSGGQGNQNLRITGEFNWYATSRSSIQVRPFRTIEQSAVFNTSTFTQSGVNISARHAIGVRTTLNGNFDFSNNDFSNNQGGTSTGNQGGTSAGNRIDNELNGGFGATYQAVKWLGIQFNYQYSQRSSTISTFEYYANTLMVSIQGVF